MWCNHCLVLIFFFTGNTGRPLDSTQAYDLATDTWSDLPDMPTPHCSCAFITFQDKLHVIGGLSMGGPSGAMESIAFTDGK